MSSLNTIVLTYGNIRTVCRVCLENKPNQFPLFTRIQLRGENGVPIPTIINDMLHKVTSELIQEESGMPIKICSQCADQLKSAYAFKIKFEESTQLLTLFLNSMRNQKHTVPQVAVTDFEPLVNTNSTITTETAAEELDCNEVIEIMSDKDIHSDNSIISNDLSDLTEEKYPCPMCTVHPLPTSIELRKHFLTHKGVGKYVNIGKANKKAKFFAEPQNNVSIFNRREILHKCPHCDEGFSADQFIVHVKSHERQAKYACDKCGRVFKTSIHLNIHRMKHSNIYPYWCDKCNKGYVIKKTYECHLLLHTVSATELPLQCTYCPKRFSNPKYLYRHEFRHKMKKDIKIYWCNRCPESFTDPNQLENHNCQGTSEGHVSNIHKEECKTNLLRSCRVCGEYSSNLSMHMKVHEKRQLCDLCGKRFQTKSQLQKHKRVHTGEKPFKCDLCGKHFPTNQQLRRHSSRIHVGLPRYMCSICGKSFHKSYLKVHEKSHEGTKKHPCPVCNKSFDFKSKLQRHFKKFHEIAQ